MPKKTTNKLTKMALSNALGIARSTLYRYLALAGAPTADAKGLYDPVVVASWVTANAPRAMDDGVIQELRTRKLRIEVERLERENAIARSELVRKSDIEPAIRGFTASVTAALEQIMVIELSQKVAGLDAIDCRKLCEESVDRLITELKAGQWALGIPKE